MLAIKSKSAPTLSSGVTTITFGQFDKVAEALVSFDGPNIDDYVFEAVRTLSANVVTIAFKKTQASAGAPTWGNAGDSDITGVITVVADGY